MYPRSVYIQYILLYLIQNRSNNFNNGIVCVACYSESGNFVECEIKSIKEIRTFHNCVYKMPTIQHEITCDNVIMYIFEPDNPGVSCTKFPQKRRATLGTKGQLLCDKYLLLCICFISKTINLITH